MRRSLSLGEEEEDPMSQMRRDPSNPEGGSGSGFSLQWEDEAVRRRLKSLNFLKDAGVENLQVLQARIHKVFAAMQDCSIEE